MYFLYRVHLLKKYSLYRAQLQKNVFVVYSRVHLLKNVFVGKIILQRVGLGVVVFFNHFCSTFYRRRRSRCRRRCRCRRHYFLKVFLNDANLSIIKKVYFATTTTRLQFFFGVSSKIQNAYLIRGGDKTRDEIFENFQKFGSSIIEANS